MQYAASASLTSTSNFYLLVVVSPNKSGALATADKTGVVAFILFLNE